MAIAAKLPLALSFGLGLSFASPAVAGSVADGTPAPAPQKGVNIASGAKAPATDEPVARLQMSSDLLAFGRDSKDPLALIVAVVSEMVMANKLLMVNEMVMANKLVMVNKLVMKMVTVNEMVMVNETW